jgi:gamma-butyrobetaine dioxygenase
MNALFPPRLASAVPAGEHAVRLTWSDGTTAAFANRVLRYACGCDACGDTDRGLRIAKLPDLPRRPKLATCAVDDEGGVALAWDDGHRTRLDAARLLAERPAKASKQIPLRLWDRTSGSAVILEIAAAAVLAEDGAGLLKALRAIRDTGLVIIRGGAATPESTEQLSARFGSVRETDYGRFFELESVPNPQVAGATSRAQSPHTDEPFRYAPPGIFFLHCLEAGAEMEGASIFVDGFAAARRLQVEMPESFHTLATEPMRFHRRHAGTVDLRCTARVLTLGSSGEVIGIRYNDRATGAFDQPLDRVDAIMDAAADFMRVVYDPAMQLTVMLQPGDTAICDNHRVMHGRRAFDPNRKRRHLRSCHIDRDQVHSRLRLMAARFAPDEADFMLPAGAGV